MFSLYITHQVIFFGCYFRNKITQGPNAPFGHDISEKYD